MWRTRPNPNQSKCGRLRPNVAAFRRVKFERRVPDVADLRQVFAPTWASAAHIWQTSVQSRSAQAEDGRCWWTSAQIWPSSKHCSPRSGQTPVSSAEPGPTLENIFLHALHPQRRRSGALNEQRSAYDVADSAPDTRPTRQNFNATRTTQSSPISVVHPPHRN